MLGGIFVSAHLMPDLELRRTGMNSSQQFSSAHLKSALTRKLNSLLPRVSGKMAAIIGFLLNATYIEPHIVEITVTSDGFAIARLENEEAAVHFLGTYSELLGNWFSVINAAGLTIHERAEALALFAAKIGFIGETSA
jgi:hypothetical protein